MIRKILQKDQLKKQREKDGQLETMVDKQCHRETDLGKHRKIF